jgi:hypothetical protein
MRQEMTMNEWNHWRMYYNIEAQRRELAEKRGE